MYCIFSDRVGNIFVKKWFKCISYFRTKGATFFYEKPFNLTYRLPQTNRKSRHITARRQRKLHHPPIFMLSKQPRTFHLPLSLTIHPPYIIEPARGHPVLRLRHQNIPRLILYKISRRIVFLLPLLLLLFIIDIREKLRIFRIQRRHMIRRRSRLT